MKPDFDAAIDELAADFHLVVEATTGRERIAAVGDALVALAQLAVAVIDGIDAENRATELPALAKKIEAHVDALATKAGAGRVVRMAVGYAVLPALERCAEGGESAKQVLIDAVLPQAEELKACVDQVVDSLRSIV